MQTITRKGKEFVLVPLEEYQRLVGLPAFPAVDPDGTSNAIEFARAAIARRLVQDRRDVGLTQQQLAQLAHVRQETISRIESGKNTVSVRTMDRIDRAIQAAQLSRKKAARKSA